MRSTRPSDERCPLWEGPPDRYGSLVATLGDVARIAVSLPGATEGERHGDLTWLVRGQAFAWDRPFSKADLRRFGNETPPAGPTSPGGWRTWTSRRPSSPRGSGGSPPSRTLMATSAVLIELSAVGKKALREAVTDAWLARAPADLTDGYLQGWTVGSSKIVGTNLVEKPSPRPARDAQAVRHIVRGAVIAGHRGGGRPGEVVVQRPSEPLVVGQANVCQRQVEASDRATVHLLVRAVATVHPHHRGLVTAGGRVGRRPPQRLRPVRSEPLGVLGVVAMAERVAHHLVRHHSLVPSSGKTQQPLSATGSLVDRLHAE